MRAVGYIRVSTEEQTREGVSLEMQAAKIRAYCELNDLELTGIVEDAGISGKSIKARPGIQEVLSMVKPRKVDAVIVYKLDRLARNTIETLEMAKDMDKAGCALHSICEKLDTQSALGRFFFTLTASLAEMERGIISERTSAALQSKKLRGERVGAIPFGYDLSSDGLHLEENPYEQNIIGRIMRTKDAGHSFRSIARELNAEGHTTKEGCAWTHKQVARIYGEVSNDKAA
jgi:site-specific DNA recombinase